MNLFTLAIGTLLILCTHAIGQTSFWTDHTTPKVPEAMSTEPVTLGLKFYSDVPGLVIGIRFYKGTSNTGTHVGTLWAGTGAKLASVTFSGETDSGWQQAIFYPPVTIAPNTTYVIAYSAPHGAHAHDQHYPWSQLGSGSLHVAGSSGGVFTYGRGALFPTNTWNDSNYWVDVVFSSTESKPAPSPGGSQSGTYYISGKVRGSAATLTLSGTASGSTNTDVSGNYSFNNLPNGFYIVAPHEPGHTFSRSTATVAINGTSIRDVDFTSTTVLTPIQHSVILNWNASTSSHVKAYNVYRADIAGGTFKRLTTPPIRLTTFTDSTVESGRTYYYVTSAVGSNNAHSGYSNTAIAVIPTP
jgi:hypothetical protein